MSAPIPKTVRDFALKHKISLGRNNFGYYIREHGLVVEQTRSAKPTVANALAMMRRHLRAHRKEGSYPAKNPTAPRVGYFVRAHHPRGGSIVGRIVKREREYGRGVVLTLDSGYSIVPADVVEIIDRGGKGVKKLKWPHTFAGGTSVPEGKYGYETERMPIGYYNVSPIAWPNGRMRGYVTTFVNDKGAVPGGLHQQLGITSSPNKAKAAASAHYQRLTTVKTNPRRRVRRAKRNPMSAQARKDFARRMARAREVKQARKRIGIKRQMRRAGMQVDAQTSTRALRAGRRATQAHGMYQIGALSADKRIAWLTSSGFTLLRGDALGYGSLAQAKARAKRLESGLVAGIFRSDVSAERARNFLLGKK